MRVPSLAWLLSMPEKQRNEFVDGLSPQAQAVLLRNWDFIARDNQLPPPGDWLYWLALAGRGFGKTRMGAEWVCDLARRHKGVRIALVARTAADARDVMVSGESGIMNVEHYGERPEYQPSRRLITWPNGSQATTYSADEPDLLRGPQHSYAWCDELCAWSYPDETWSNLIFGLRLGNDPRCMITTTPRPIGLLKRILADPRTVVTRGGTLENKANLAQSAIDQMVAQYGGTRLGRQELEGEVLTDVPGALWSLDTISRYRVKEAPDCQRIVVAVDPPATTGENADECGIVAVGIDADKHLYVVADDSSKGETPEQWARRSCNLYHRLNADRLVAEVNNGGAMVEAVIRSSDPSISYRAVHATRGKVRRAEPVAALYEQGRVHHVGEHKRLEEQLCELTPDFDASKAGFSPDRADALVWAISDLMNLVTKQTVPPRTPRALYQVGSWAA